MMIIPKWLQIRIDGRKAARGEMNVEELRAAVKRAGVKPQSQRKEDLEKALLSAGFPDTQTGGGENAAD